MHNIVGFYVSIVSIIQKLESQSTTSSILKDEASNLTEQLNNQMYLLKEMADMEVENIKIRKKCSD